MVVVVVRGGRRGDEHMRRRIVLGCQLPRWRVVRALLPASHILNDPIKDHLDPLRINGALWQVKVDADSG